jgi:hypothetical protein
MWLFDLFKRKKRETQVDGQFSYIPGSQTFNEDEPIIVEGDEIVKRMYVQPEDKLPADHSSIRIYTGNPFRAMTVDITV